ncbi:MAG: 4-hydroxy-3-methylbut-2-en-1-yl diphosphate synthase, partial [Sphingobacteriaceae bacterium]
MVDAGCEYVRITAPSVKEAQNLAEIKKQLRAKGYNVPLVADIHFTPNAAEVAARLVEKVRINPGNYADKKRFDELVYTEAEYQNELERIFKKFTPLVNICKEYGTAMRIGTNHGSLSDRIMSQYGDTPRGMVESAMEFIRMCESLNYYNLVISMKSSNPQVMVQAYRMLVETMVAENMNYPLHLGVTEAGDGEDGRIKSAVGIGTLLEDGLGDTVRVSLTEEPEHEAPVAIALVERYVERSLTPALSKGEGAAAPTEDAEPVVQLKSLSFGEGFRVRLDEYKKRQTYEANAFIGGSMVPRVVLDLSAKNLKDPMIMADAGYLYSPLLDKYNMADQSVDFVYLADNLPSFTFPGNLKQLYNYKTWHGLAQKKNCHPVFSLEEYHVSTQKDTALNLVCIKNSDLETEAFKALTFDETLVFVLETDQHHGMADQRECFFYLQKNGIEVPVIVKRSYLFEGARSEEQGAENFIADQNPVVMSSISALRSTDPITNLQLYAATDFGALLVDGFGDGIWIDAPEIEPKIITSTAFGILQATRS